MSNREKIISKKNRVLLTLGHSLCLLLFYYLLRGRRCLRPEALPLCKMPLFFPHVVLMFITRTSVAS